MKSVTFADNDSLAEVVVLLPKLEEMSEQELTDQWFARTECEAMASTATMIARESRSSCILSKMLEDTFLSDDPATTQRVLNKWARCGHSRRGLECFINHKHRRQRQEARKIVVRSLLTAQYHHEGDMVLARVCSETSARAAVFARMMGVADAEAALLADSAHPLYPLRSKAPVFEQMVEAPKRLSGTDWNLPASSLITVRIGQTQWCR